MQKKLIALAVTSLAASSVFAQSNVTIGGWMSIDAKIYKASDINRAARGNVQNFHTEYRVDDDTNSRIWFTGKEDLGGGMDAHFYMESRFGADNGNAATTFGLANGDTYVGFGTPVGTFDFGRLSTYYVQGILGEMDSSLSGNSHLTLTTLSTMGTMLVNGYGRNSNNIRYITPRVSGFQGTLVVSPNFAGDEGKIPTAGAAVNQNYATGSSWMAAANYMSGPVYLNAAWWQSRAEGRPATPLFTMLLADQEAYRLTGTYTLPFGLKVGLAYDHFKVKNLAAGVTMPVVFFGTGLAHNAVSSGGSVATNGSISRNAWILPINYAFGKNNVFFKYGQAGNITNWATPAGRPGGTGAKFYVLGYDYALSRRTSIGLSYSVTNNAGNGMYQPFGAGSTHTGSGLIAGEKATVMQASLTHRF